MRIEILKNSLIKKQAKLDNKFDAHFADVKSGNGQPMNDKRNGQATISRWEKQNDSIRTAKKEIEKTKNAIEREENKIVGCENVLKGLPSEILTLLHEGKITQWKKFPNRFFVAGVERARLVFENGKIMHQYVNEIPKATGQFEIFKEVFNYLNNTVNKS